MKRTIIITAILAAITTSTAYSQNITRDIQDIKRNAEWRFKSRLNYEIGRSIDDMFNQKRRENQERRKKMTWECPHCHSKGETDYCTHCGTPKPIELTPWECPHCHTHNEDGTFCGHCGHERTRETYTVIQNIKETPTVTLEQLSRLSERQ